MPDPSPLLKIPETRPARWELLSLLIADWYAPLKPGDGYDDADLSQASDRLEIPIPAAMREWYALAGRRDDIWSRQDSLLPPKKLFCADGVLYFCIENQAVTCWGVPLDQLSHDDPPVVVHEEKGWVIQSPRFSEFALHLFAFVIQWGGGRAHITGFAPQPCLQRIITTIPALGFPEFIWAGVRLFGFRDLIISIDSTDHLAASARTVEHMAPFRRIIEEEEFDLIWQDPPDP